MIVRTKFKGFKGKKFTVRLAVADDEMVKAGRADTYDILICLLDSGEPVATIRNEDFFDSEGNRFEY